MTEIKTFIFTGPPLWPPSHPALLINQSPVANNNVVVDKSKIYLGVHFIVMFVYFYHSNTLREPNDPHL